MHWPSSSYVSRFNFFQVLQLAGNLSKTAQSREGGGIFPSLPNTSTFGVNSSQLAKLAQTANSTKQEKDPKSQRAISRSMEKHTRP